MQRRQTWYVRVTVPPRLREAVGNTHVVRSLKTRDLAEAQRLRLVAVAQIKAELDAIGKGEDGSAVAAALIWRDVWINSDASAQDNDHGHTEQQGIEIAIESHAEKIEKAQGIEAAKDFYKIATSNSPLLSETRDLWLPEASRTITKQTARQYDSDTSRFLEWATKKRVLLVSDVTKRLAGSYVSEAFPDVAAKTANRHISSLSMWWRWLEQKGMTDANPWQGQVLRVRGKRANREDNRRAYNADEIKTLLSGLKKRPLDALFRLGLFTGARLDELCSLQAGDVVEREGSWWLSITEGKTENAVRMIPVHSAIEPLVVTLKQEAASAKGNADGWLFPDITPGGPDNKRSWNVSKKFTRERRKLGVDTPQTVFHSTRKNLLEALEAGEVPLSTAKLIVGHERGDIAFGGYSKGTYVDLKSAIERAVFPPGIMESM
ncbi:DUF6538 domain-containing protein [Azospirillum formosense]|uniref:DUF6538 domain-containing protein n=1 Tax=Azospirillum formosense TaxID=861533 RepID=UPI00338E0357